MNEKANFSPKLSSRLTALPLIGLVALLLLCFFLWLILRQIPSITPKTQQTTITHSLVLDKIQAVAKLVSSETTMRDVIVYEDTWYGSTKRSLVVVTGKILAGINLEKKPDVTIDEAAHRIKIKLPEAEILATDVIEYKTYDEQRGLWNPFQPADRDKIFQQARQQFEGAAKQSKIIEHANQSAKQLLEAMFSKDGFITEVSVTNP